MSPEQSDLYVGWSELWRPPERLPLSQWAEQNFVLSDRYSAKTGQLRLYGWQREIFDSFTDPRVQKIVLKVGTQMVKTLFIQAVIAYTVCELQGPILVAQPNEGDAETFSKERLASMISDMLALRGKFGDPKKRDASNTTLYKEFPGGTLSVVGAQTPGNAARRSIMVACLDECNKYPPSSGKEGFFGGLVEERTATFRSRKKIIYTCSPTTPDGAISKEYASTDQREPWCECWNCGEYQVLKWTPNVKFQKHGTIAERAASAVYECEHCGAPWNDSQRIKSADRAEWKANQPFSGSAGFTIGHLCSANKKLSEMTAFYLKATAGTTDNLRVFINTNLAQDWIEDTDIPDWERVAERAEAYEPGVVPAAALFVTGTADVQGDRIEVEFKAWGRNRECWSIWYEVIQPTRKDSSGAPVICRPSEPEPWLELAELIQREWACEGGGSLPVWAFGVDTGYNSGIVYDFCKRYPQPIHGPMGSTVPSLRTVVPLKGGHSQVKLIEGVSDADARRD